MKKDTRIVTIGGGSGMPIVNRALVKAGYENISSIVTIFDSGGDTGRMRTDERGRILAFSDYWRALMSLWSDDKQKSNWEEMLRFRDGRSRNFGNIFFQFLSERSGGLDNVDELFTLLTGATIVGQVIPVSNEPAEVCFETKNKRIYKGEHRLDELRMSTDRVVDIWLEPKVKANKHAIEAIKKADIIIVCPGSMYGSVITNFLPKGIAEAYKVSKAKKILMTNIMSVANENDGFSQRDYVKVMSKYLGGIKPFDLIIMSKIDGFESKLLKKVLHSYSMEHSKPIRFEIWKDIETWVEDIAIIEEKNFRMRHSEEKMSQLFKTI